MDAKTAADSGRESKARRRLRILGYRLKKRRDRDPISNRFGTYELIEAVTGNVLLITLRNIAEVERWTTGREAGINEMLALGMLTVCAPGDLF